MPQQRRSDRLFLQIPIHVSGTDAQGGHFEEDTFTVHVNQHGGCISLIHSLQPGGTIHVRHLVHGREQEFRVVGLVREIFGNHAEWGVELTDPSHEFWGIEFTPPPESIGPKALVQCQACAQVVLAPLSHSGYEILLHTGLLSRHCDRCGKTTRWQPAEAPAGKVAASSPVQPLTHDERRKTRRRRLAMRIQSRRASGQTELVRTLDVSIGGFAFISQQVFRVGEEVGFVLPFGARNEPVETPGHIAWARQTAAGWVYGVSFATDAAASERSSEKATESISHRKAS